MNKKLLIPALLTLAISSCIKKDAAVSTTVTTSFPTITITSGYYYSVALNSPYPTVTTAVTDSFYNPTTSFVVDSSIHTNVAGLYMGTVEGKNSKGFVSYANFYVAVTNISSSLNLSGTWWPSGTSTGDSATTITELANGLYYSTNLGGIADTASAVQGGIFAVLSTTSIVFAPNNTAYVSLGALSMIPADTTISYMNSAGNTITFKKQ